MITVPRGLVLGLAALLSGYHVMLGVYSLGVPAHPGPPLVALTLYSLATVMSLWPTSPMRMPLWLSFFSLAVCVALPLLVGSQLNGADPSGGYASGYATWYVAAVGTLMTIVATRKRQVVAWIGIGFLVVHTVVWAGPAALVGMGVIGSVVWVTIAVTLSRGLARAGRDARQFARAEREATEWQAAQEARLYERQVRLEHTNRLAVPMLRRIVARRGILTEEERQECRYLEAAIRDEIRGRQLLNDPVRDAVMAARRRGALVTLLDEGGIDDIEASELNCILNELAAAIAQTSADTIIARTVADGGATAITVVGLRSSDPSVSALGLDSPDDEVDLWLEIPRLRATASHALGAGTSAARA
ncbi:hypothetical protein [Glaciibacter psychrotolerans]|uniref:Uncharacterized protein n=1 Tax=Glaciibacter psychrotolerans TaxID=670054 RepID=A0A7Z0EEP3_9MICO|nr:hypothetical protein [Leifsonia psychrotolerans]NYJ20277.1 hypothetical protein [Leifsonia psychrotolerans]